MICRDQASIIMFNPTSSVTILQSCYHSTYTHNEYNWTHVKPLQEMKTCISSSTLLLSHTSHTVCSTDNLSYLPVSIMKGAVLHLNMEKHLRNLKSISLLRYVSVSKVFLNAQICYQFLAAILHFPIKIMFPFNSCLTMKAVIGCLKYTKLVNTFIFNFEKAHSKSIKHFHCYKTPVFTSALSQCV